MPRLSKIGAAALAAFGWTTGAAAVTVDFLVIAGGGSGGAGNGGGGGGGAGGYRCSVTGESSGGGASAEGKLSLSLTESYTVIVGAGGAGTGSVPYRNSGSNSVFSSITSTGGGGGGYDGTYPPLTGGSGGGGNYSSTAGAAGTANQGFAGGANTASSGAYGGGGGGGAAAVGAVGTSSVGGNGGNGVASSISGSSVTRAGGGGGGSNDSSAGGTGGSGGGGNGGNNNTNNATAGSASTGSGGGAGGGGSQPGRNGGSGIVIISYVGAQQFGGGVVTVSGGNTIHTFTTSGTLSPLNALTASYLIVAGGGGGGTSEGGGGGAGGMQTGSGLTIDTNSIYAVTVGAGGAGDANGANSSFSLVSTASVGGGAGGTSGNGSTGGSGGGGGANGSGTSSGGLGTASQGNAGGTGAGVSANRGAGGGGGAFAVGGAGTGSSGGIGGAGGNGLPSSITGSSVTYAGGGGGNSQFASGTASGGTGGGGTGGNTNSLIQATNGTANLGGGGGGGSYNSYGGIGGSGIVIISYPGSTQQMAGGTVTVAGGNVIHTFTSSGYLTPIVLVTNSLRFRASATAYLNRTGSTATNAQKATYSFWMKRGTLTTGQWIFTGGASSATTLVGFNGSSDALSVLLTDVSGEGNITAAVFRDPSAWYHVVIAIDTTQATTADRAKIYVNGVLQTVTVANGGIGLNANWGFNTANTLNIGRYGPSASSYFDGYLADVNFIDGQALTPNSFGTSNGLGVWQPIRYGGSYGTNGFYLPFINNATGTSLSANFLVVAGGAGGGEYWSGGGGGAGGLRSSVTATGGGGTLESALTINTNSTYLVTVGGGGPGAATGGSGTKGTNGSNSVFSTVTSTGGGAGGLYDNFNGNSGGSGGGGFYGGTGGAGTANQGFAGGAGASSGFGNESGGGGGGGAGAVGAAGAYAVGGNGGAGVSVAITGSSVPYAGGGGGSVYTGTGGTGGSGGGANGVANGGGNGNNGSPNTGGGASGTATFPLAGGNGGSGVVIISYAGDVKFTGGTITRSGGNTIHTFTSSGVLTSVFSDYSPNGNNWTGNNFNVTTSGSTYDSMTDVPTLTSTTTANYAVWNPLDKNSNGSIINGNLDNSNGSANNAGVRSTFALPLSGKWYAELRVNSSTSGSVALGFGFATSTADLAGSVDGANKYVIYGSSSGSIFSNTSTITSSLGSFTVGDILQIAYDGATGKAWLGKNNTWYNSTGGTTGDPSAGTNQTFTLTTEMFLYSYYYNVSGSLNCGQRPLNYTPPTDFKALNTFNLPTPTIGATASTTANKYFDATLYTGNGGSLTVTNTAGFQPDFVWTKSRSNGSTNHLLEDVIRGTKNSLLSNSTSAELARGINAFLSNGFSFNDDAGGDGNVSGQTYVGWQWRASNATAVTNTAGSITSTVSANTTSGFSIVTYTGNGTTGATFGHGLGVTPSMVIIKKRSTGTAGNWITYHTSTGINQYLYLNSTTAAATSSPTWGVSSTVITLQQSFNDYNTSTAPYVAYCFAQIAGYSAFGSYTGNGSADGPFVFTGFRPRWVMVKNITSAQSWQLMDTSRSTYNVATANLLPNSSSAELTGTDFIDMVSNGFKIRQSSAGNWNNSGDTYIYVCFAENPFKYANAR